MKPVAGFAQVDRHGQTQSAEPHHGQLGGSDERRSGHQERGQSDEDDPNCARSSDVESVLGLALLAGQQGAAGGRLLLALLPVSWWLGGSVGQLWGLDHTLSLITTLMVTAVGVLVALAQKLRSAVFASLVTSFGLLFGVVNGFTMPAVRQGVSLVMLGVVTAVAVLSVLISGQVVVMRSPAVKIAVRVMGSWIAAAGLLSLGLWLKG